LRAYTLTKKCEAKQSIVSESDRHGGLFSFVQKQSTGLFLPNQRFGVLVGGSSPRIIIDNIKEKKKATPKCCLELIGGL